MKHWISLLSGGRAEHAAEPPQRPVPAARAAPRRQPQRRAQRNGVTIGLALGAGVARGWSHIGVIQGLEQLGIRPHVVCGCSMGALVGAAYAYGQLEALRRDAIALTRIGLLRLIDFSWGGGGLVKGERVVERLLPFIPPVLIEDLPVRFGAVTTTMDGEEMWKIKGLLSEAVRASISLPGLFMPTWDGQRFLMDGALVNPLPVSPCRALGADVVIAVRTGSWEPPDSTPRPPEHVPQASESLKDHAARLLRRHTSHRPAKSWDHSTLRVASYALDTMLSQICRYRLKAEPADLVLEPRPHVGLLDFHCAKTAIQAGEDCVRKAEAALRRLCMF